MTKKQTQNRIDEWIVAFVWISFFWLVAGRALTGVSGWLIELTVLPGIVVAIIYCSVITAKVKKRHDKRMPLMKPTRLVLLLISASLFLWGLAIVDAGSVDYQSILAMASGGLLSNEVSAVISWLSFIAFIGLNIALGVIGIVEKSDLSRATSMN